MLAAKQIRAEESIDIVGKALAKTERVFHVAEAQTGATLAAALRAWLHGESWRTIKRMVQTRHVMINGNMCVDAERRLKADDVVKVMPHPLAPPPSEGSPPRA